MGGGVGRGMSVGGHRGSCLRDPFLALETVNFSNRWISSPTETQAFCINFATAQFLVRNRLTGVRVERVSLDKFEMVRLDFSKHHLRLRQLTI